MFFPIALALVLLPLQNEKSGAGQDGLALLKEVGQRYADAKSYHIEAVEERNSSNELERSWQKTLMKAIVTPGGRYRYEGRSGYGAAMYVSDGTTQWIYHVNEHLYTQKPAEGRTRDIASLRVKKCRPSPPKDWNPSWLTGQIT